MICFWNARFRKWEPIGRHAKARNLREAVAFIDKLRNKILSKVCVAYVKK